jgi:dTDP-4-amino-4,6-dideoxygalactose transaminase
MLIALMALGLRAVDKVITPPFSLVATSEKIARLGALQVYVDINPPT